MDDIFATTDQDRLDGNPAGTIARVKPAELSRHIKWQQALKTGGVASCKPPAGSSIT
jgi:hypothetical protein